MEEFLLMELIKKRSKNDPEFETKLYELMREDEYEPRYTHRESHKEHTPSMFDRFVKNETWHYSNRDAKYLVTNMHHYDHNNKIVSGEHFSMARAENVCHTYKKMFDLDITPADVYVAINAQYHDYCLLFKSWFGSNIDNKIIESAMCFWFKDVDYDKGSKLMNYFRES